MSEPSTCPNCARLEAENAALRRELDRAAGPPGAWTRADAEALEEEPPLFLPTAPVEFPIDSPSRNAEPSP